MGVQLVHAGNISRPFPQSRMLTEYADRQQAGVQLSMTAPWSTHLLVVDRLQPSTTGTLLPHRLIVGRYAQGRWQTVRENNSWQVCTRPVANSQT